ncbi:MAG: energy-coupled thiamine transporter ThiT [Clostridia bacterium]|nr:energy-coupled thiamine transporter ThiT [Clostridia bacterium]
MFFNLLSSVYAADIAEPIIKWLTIGFVGAIVLTLLITLLVKREIIGGVAKVSLYALVLFALCIGITMLSLEIAKHYDLAYLEENWVSKDIVPFVFIPILVTLILLLVGSILLFFITKKKPELKKITGIIVGAICGVALVITIVLIAIFYSSNIVGDGYYSEHLDNLALYLSAGLLIVLAIGAALILGKKDKGGFSTRSLALAGVCIALSFALSYIKLWEMPQGGTVTLASMLPIMIFSYIYGSKKGILIGLIYGLLQAVQDPYIVHPAQFLLDYPIAFALTGFAGSLKYVNVFNSRPQIKFAIGAIIGAALRFFAHVLSGVFAFGAYAGDQNFWVYSLAYNSFVFIDVLLVIVVGVMLFSSKAFVKEINKDTIENV